MKDKVYICGPMSGYPEGNYPAFDEVKDRAIKFGFEVVSPVDLNRMDNMPVPDENANPLSEATFHFIVKRDLNAVMGCKGLILLPQWCYSKGALTEYYLARWLGLKFYRSIDFSIVEMW